MSIRQSKLIRLALQHSFAARPVAGSDRVIELDIPHGPYVHSETGESVPAGTDTYRVSTTSELLECLGY